MAEWHLLALVWLDDIVGQFWQANGEPSARHVSGLDGALLVGDPLGLSLLEHKRWYEIVASSVAVGP